MVYWRENKPKLYDRAIKEIWRAVSNNFDRDPIKEVAAKLVLDINKYMTINKVALIKEIKSEGVGSLTLKEAPPKVKGAAMLIMKTYRIEYSGDQKIYLGVKDKTYSISVLSAKLGDLTFYL
jgi:hypothetical protein